MDGAHHGNKKHGTLSTFGVSFDIVRHAQAFSAWLGSLERQLSARSSMIHCLFLDSIKCGNFFAFRNPLTYLAMTVLWNEEIPSMFLDHENDECDVCLMMTSSVLISGYMKRHASRSCKLIQHCFFGLYNSQYGSLHVGSV